MDWTCAPCGKSSHRPFKGSKRTLLGKAGEAATRTSADYRKEWRTPAPPALSPIRAVLSGDGVYYLPGRIPIGPAQATEAPVGPRTGTTIVKRFWVRGHRRRPHGNWQDQRVRWIAPYLKGPDVAAIVEREYALGSVDP